MGFKLFDSDSVVKESTNIDVFIPPNPGWNFVRLLHHPEDNSEYHPAYCGKWLLFVPDEDFVSVFRTLAKLTRDYNLTQCFKASGRPDNKNLHVFCIYCLDCKDFPFVKKIANKLNNLGFIKKYGYTYRGGQSAIFFKTDGATHYKSRSRGSSLTLFRYMEDDKLYVKRFNQGIPSWVLVKKNEAWLVEEFIMNLQCMGLEDYD